MVSVCLIFNKGVKCDQLFLSVFFQVKRKCKIITIIYIYICIHYIYIIYIYFLFFVACFAGFLIVLTVPLCCRQVVIVFSQLMKPRSDSPCSRDTWLPKGDSPLKCPQRPRACYAKYPARYIEDMDRFPWRDLVGSC